jgi:uncharacterized protein
MGEQKKCEVCYTCNSNIIPTKTKADIQAAIKKFGKIPQEWYRDNSNCGSCVTCEKCDTKQGSCEKCFSCEKGDTKQKSCDSSITYFLFPTNNCNLRCDYCYATKTPPSMSKELMDQVIDFIVFEEEKRLPNRGISIQFFGGEPLLKWNLLRYTVNTANGRMAQHLKDRKIKWGMTTNGTLLDEKKLRWMKTVGLTPLFSIDGRKETHNRHRIYANGKGSWDDIPIDLILQYFPNPEIRPTILPDTVGDWINDVKWFHSKGCYTVATEVAYEADWDANAMRKAWTTYNKMADLYIELKNKGQQVWMKFINDGANFLGSREQTGSICGIAKNTVAINAKGDLFSCQRYASFSDAKLKLGNIKTGWNESKLKQANSLCREKMIPVNEKYDCNTCHAKYRCKGGCNAMNFQCHGDRRLILENHCKFLQMWSTIAFRALASTGELWDKFGIK